MDSAFDFAEIEPQNLYNLDEKGFMIGLANSSRIIIRKDPSTRTNAMKKAMSDGNRELVTVLECIGADGWVAPPGVIMKGQTHQRGWYSALDSHDIGPALEGYSYGYSDNGWIDTGLYFDWIKTIYEPETRHR